ncbi:hypothetical protein C8Q80DRAFT_1275452 [Daedaleopsis nitida]|nr:hypothetical protein C8Q80DRAFT_1275452 [Daedaleopsis nitida]
MPPTAGHPFNQSTADIIITSSDDVPFRLHRIILSLASDFFSDMLSLPQPTQNQRADETDVIPTISVSESSEVLEKLFRLCYPVDDPPMKTIEEVRSILEAAMKYQMSEAVKITKRKLLALASTDPLRVYCVACQFGLEEEASAAAKEVYRQKAQDRYVEDLEETSIGAYHRLLSFCERHGRVRGERFRFTVHRNGRDDAAAPPTPSIAQLTLEPPDLSADARVAPYPFDLAEAEVVLVTSDSVEFRVFQQILALCSPVLSARAKDLPPSAPSTIDVSEHSRIFSILLQLSYPTAEPRLEDLLDISAALAAAEKYEMQRASQVLRAVLASRRDSPSEDSTTLYAIASRFGMRELAVAAAKRTLRTEIMRASASISDLDALGVSAGCFYRLLDYHRRCRAAVRSIFNFDNSGDWIDYEMSTQLHSCCRSAFGSAPRTPCWFNVYMQRVGAEEWPKSASATDSALLQSVLEATPESGYSCGYCLDVQSVFVLIRFSKYVAETMDSLEASVALKWVGSGPSPSPVPLR